MVFEDYADPGKRFALRELEQDDLPGLEAIDRAVFFSYLRHVKGPRRFLDDAIAARLTEPRPAYELAVVLPDDRRRLIGLVVAEVEDSGAGTHSLDFGYAVVPEFQRRGIAKSAVLAFLAKIATARTVELTATADPDNVPSIRLLEALGFARFGLVQATRYLGDPDDPAHYAAGILQMRPRVEYRMNTNSFWSLHRQLGSSARPQ